jgi:hypothetical protein
MVTNFEEITKDLTESDLKIIDTLINGFKTKTIDNPIKAQEIVKRFNEFAEITNQKDMKLTEVKLRKYVNYIRSNSLLPLIATSKGYYTSYDKDEILKQVISLKERASSIRGCAEGLKEYLG